MAAMDPRHNTEDADVEEQWRRLLGRFQDDLRAWSEAADTGAPTTDLEALVKKHMTTVENASDGDLGKCEPNVVASVCLGVGRLSEFLVSLPTDNFEVDARAWKVVTKLLQRHHARLAGVLEEAVLLDVALHALEDGLATLQMAADDPQGMGPKARTPLRSAKFIKASASRLAMVIRLSKKLQSLRDDPARASEELHFRVARTAVTLPTLTETAAQCQVSTPPASELVRQAADTIAHVLAATASPQFDFGILVLESLCRQRHVEAACTIWAKLAVTETAASASSKACDKSSTNTLARAIDALASLAARPGSLEAFSQLCHDKNIAKVADGVVSVFSVLTMDNGMDSMRKDRHMTSQECASPLDALLAAALSPCCPRQAFWAAAVLEKSTDRAHTKNLVQVTDALALCVARNMLRLAMSATRSTLFASKADKENGAAGGIFFGSFPTRKTPRPFYESLLAHLALCAGPQSFVASLLLNRFSGGGKASSLTMRDLCCARVLASLPRAKHPAADIAIIACSEIATSLLVTISKPVENKPALVEAKRLAQHALLGIIRILHFFSASSTHGPQLATLGAKILHTCSSNPASSKVSPLSVQNAVLLEVCDLMCVPEIARLLGPSQTRAMMLSLGKLARNIQDDAMSTRVAMKTRTTLAILALLAAAARFNSTALKDEAFVKHAHESWNVLLSSCTCDPVLLSLALAAFERFIKTLPSECTSQLASFLPTAHRDAFGKHLKRKRELVEAQESPLAASWLSQAAIATDWDLQAPYPAASLRKRQALPQRESALSAPHKAILRATLGALEIALIDSTSIAINCNISDSDISKASSSPKNEAFARFQTHLLALRQEWAHLRAAESEIANTDLQSRARTQVNQLLREFVPY
ncbi:Hypothetical Protein FCC1311_054762 [Hondaea fermentalgiana]|uniref:Uncharacterized protein n=1 Tax=Hondaea fermentalgiana TaxID=2315210 RepID=A0A2R5GN09_9STRA|nr:Hypothetical Protein FCC1311_054762 [Hondaea fermentalgiana]|eukprot:GBG29254.1 Hypothetical Protein FCC1311_054762 [Hondaea fermentalgiana]